jgi:hypothetical protein
MANGSMTLTQAYQMVKGSITVDGTTHAITNRALGGEEITFIAGGFTYQGKIKGDQIEGTITTPAGQLPWKATRTASASPR